jgi:hypothetical protein
LIGIKFLFQFVIIEFVTCFILVKFIVIEFVIWFIFVKFVADVVRSIMFTFDRTPAGIGKQGEREERKKI